MSGLAGERVIEPSVTWWASLSVTEMIANRGSTASSKVSATYFGGESSVALGDG